MTSINSQIATALLLLRLSVFLVFLMWTLDKFVNPAHAAAVFENFYLIGGLGPVIFYILGFVELVILIGFLVGYQKTMTYGIILILHGISTLSSFPQYLDPFENLLFFAAWPMLAACYTLFSLRDLDTRWTVKQKQ